MDRNWENPGRNSRTSLGVLLCAGNSWEEQLEVRWESPGLEEGKAVNAYQDMCLSSVRSACLRAWTLLQFEEH